MPPLTPLLCQKSRWGGRSKGKGQHSRERGEGFLLTGMECAGKSPRAFWSRWPVGRLSEKGVLGFHWLSLGGRAVVAWLASFLAPSPLFSLCNYPLKQSYFDINYMMFCMFVKYIWDKKKKGRI